MCPWKSPDSRGLLNTWRQLRWEGTSSGNVHVDLSGRCSKQSDSRRLQIHRYRCIYRYISVVVEEDWEGLKISVCDIGYALK